MPLKNSTLVILPSLSDAVAVILMEAGAVKDWPGSGLVMLTVGEVLLGAITVIVTELIAEFPSPSIAFAFKE